MGDPEDGRALLIFDGECAFCKTWVDAWRAETVDRVTYATSQEIAADFPDIPREKYRRAVQLIDGAGKRYEGAEAIFCALSLAPGRGWLRDLYHAPLIAPVSEWAYLKIARHRPFFLRLTRLLWGKRVESSRYSLTARLFLQALGVVYFTAFVSLIPQLPGLVGPSGILPSGISGGVLQLVAGLGAAIALTVAVGFVMAPSILALWALYLLLVIAGQDFLVFQWDSLLLEAGFLAIFLTPLAWSVARPARVAVSRLVIGLYRFLLFRLVLSSGISKLISGDRTWRNLTALRYHFETQPLPTPFAWYAHHLPDIVLKSAAATTLIIEIGAPILFFLPRRARHLGALIVAVFQLLLMATGNFAFFNWLTLALCLLLLDDALLESLFARFRAMKPEPVPHAEDGRVRRLTLKALAVVVLILGLTHLTTLFVRPPAPLLLIEAIASPLRIVNGYGLFAVMTTERPEIVVEGSDDGVDWKEYVFRDKPGDVKRAPGFIAPFQPRLDRQMWFAALGTPEDSPWVRGLMLRLLQGSKPVVSLFRTDPFPDAPPKFVRAELYLYRFTSSAERKADGAWWRRQFKVEFLPPLSLAELQGERP